MKVATETNLYRAKATWPIGNAWSPAWTDKDQAEKLARWYCQTWETVGVKAKSAVFYRDGSFVSEFSNNIQ